jgi:hypothetical protein
MSRTACYTPPKVAVAAIRPVSVIALALVIDQPLSAGASRFVRLCRWVVAMS